MNVTVNTVMEEIFNDRYIIIGYIFGFVGSLALIEQILLAFALGFAGAVGGWVFEKIREFVIDKIKDWKEKRNNNGQD